MDNRKRYEEALDWIHGLGRFGIKPGLTRMVAMLEQLGNPQEQINFVHIAGTNGKGSTAAMLASMMRAAGYRTGLFTSPYLLSFTNRMAVDGSDIEQDRLIELVDLVKPVVEQAVNDPDLGQPTEFEVVTVLAMLHFARAEVDLVILEAGLGGRLDATNVVTPLLSIITNISLEHTVVLGDTIEKIAFEKAGIIKKGRPLLTAAADQRALQVFEKRCRELESSCYRVFQPVKQGEKTPGRPYAELDQITEDGQFFSYKGFQKEYDRLHIPLRGSYQLENAAVALAAVELLSNYNFLVSEEAVRQGISATTWPGRLEVLKKDPLLIMDGAHNPAAIEKLAQAIPEYFKFDRLIMVFGMLADKDMSAMLKTILPLADEVFFTRPSLPRAAEPEDVAAFAVNELGFKLKYRVIAYYGEALDLALQAANPSDAVLVTGSLYTVSDIRAYYTDKS